jgi:hypothetical protein
MLKHHVERSLALLEMTRLSNLAPYDLLESWIAP